jgi:hypothetical protein
MNSATRLVVILIWFSIPLIWLSIIYGVHGVGHSTLMVLLVAVGLGGASAFLGRVLLGFERREKDLRNPDREVSR